MTDKLDPSEILQPGSGGTLATFTYPPAFPFTFWVGKTTFTLHLDGTIEGDRDAVIEAMAQCDKGGGIGDVVVAVVWPIVHLSEPQRWRKPE